MLPQLIESESISKKPTGFSHCRASMGLHYNERDFCKDYASQLNLPGVWLKRVKKKQYAGRRKPI
jgi:hypothetical protein